MARYYGGNMEHPGVIRDLVLTVEFAETTEPDGTVTRTETDVVKYTIMWVHTFDLT